MKQSLKKHIKSQGRTLKWVAEKIGISPELLSMKLGPSKKARLDKITIHKVCKVIDVDLDDVLRNKIDLSKSEIEAIIYDFENLDNNTVKHLAEKHKVTISAMNVIINNHLKDVKA